MTYLKDINIKAQDSASIDAFGRWRVSEPATLFDSKQLHDDSSNFWDDQETSGSGTTSTFNTNEASTTIGVALNTAGTRVRQTKMRFNYQPGKSQLILMTTNVNGTASGITSRVGLFDNDNGIYFEADDTTLYVVRRTNVTGTPVNNRVAQSSWNGDTMDGNGDSGITIDPTKTQILWIDYEWLGVGRVRMGFVVDGKFYQVHEFLNTNSLDKVYMSTPNLPLRYEISNDGTGVASTLTHICSSVMSEGGTQENGIVYSDNLSSSTVNANTVGTAYAIQGIRLKSGYLDSVVKILTVALLATTSDNYLWELRFNPTVAGTFTYSDRSESAVQIADGDTSGNPSTNTVTGGQVIASGYATGNSADTGIIQSARYLGSLIDGTVDEIVLCVTPLTVNLDITGGITWRELS